MALQQQKQARRRRSSARGGVAVVAVVAALAFSAIFVAANDSIVATAPAQFSLGPVFVAEEALDSDDRVEASEEDQALASSFLETMMTEASTDDADNVDVDAKLQEALEGAAAAAAASAPVCSSVESCLALCPTTNFLTSDGASEGSVEESILACINAVRTSPKFFADELRGLCDYDSFAAQWEGTSTNPPKVRKALDALPALRATAHAQALDMATRSKLTTNSSTGLDPTQRVKALYPSAKYAAELVAGGFSDVRSFVMALSCSAPHRSLLLSCSYDSGGAGIEFDQKKDDGSVYSPAPLLRTYEAVDFACVNANGCSCTSAPVPPPPSPSPTPAPTPAPTPSGNATAGPGSTTFAMTFSTVPDSASSDVVYSLMATYAGAIAKFVSPSAVKVSMQRASTADGPFPAAPLQSFVKSTSTSPSAEEHEREQEAGRAVALASARTNEEGKDEDDDGSGLVFNFAASSVAAADNGAASAAEGADADVDSALVGIQALLEGSHASPSASGEEALRRRGRLRRRRSLSSMASQVAVADASVAALASDAASVAASAAAASPATLAREAAAAELGARSAPVVATLKFTLTLSSLPAPSSRPSLALSSQDAALKSAVAEAEIARGITESLRASAAPAPVSVAVSPVTTENSGSNLAFDVAVSFPPEEQTSSAVGKAVLSAASLASRVREQPQAALSQVVARNGPASSSSISVSVDGIDVPAATAAALASGAFDKSASPFPSYPPLAGTVAGTAAASSTSWTPKSFPNGRVAGTSGAQTTQGVINFDLAPTAPVNDKAAFDRAVWRAIENFADPVPVKVVVTRASATAPADAAVKVAVTFPPADSVSATTSWATQQASRVGRALRTSPASVLGADLASELGIATPPKPSNINTKIGVVSASPSVSPAPPDLALDAPAPPPPTTTPPTTTKPPPPTTKPPPPTTKPPPQTTKPPPPTTTTPPATTKPPPPPTPAPTTAPMPTATPAPTPIPPSSRLVLLASSNFAGTDGGAKAAWLAAALKASPETVLGASVSPAPTGTAVVSLVAATTAP